MFKRNVIKRVITSVIALLLVFCISIPVLALPANSVMKYKKNYRTGGYSLQFVTVNKKDANYTKLNKLYNNAVQSSKSGKKMAVLYYQKNGGYTTQVVKQSKLKDYADIIKQNTTYVIGNNLKVNVLGDNSGASTTGNISNNGGSNGSSNGDNSSDSESSSSSSKKSSTTSTTGLDLSDLSGADKIIAVNIAMAQGKTITQEDISDLTQDEMKFLGVYLSNYFIPFSTELGVESSKSDKTNETKEQITSVLTSDPFSFTDAIAEDLTETLLGLARSNSKELKVAFSNKYQKDYKVDDKLQSDYILFLSSMTGKAKDYLKEQKDGQFGPTRGIKEKTLKKYNYIYFGYEGSDGFVPVFDANISGEGDFTPSQIAFLKCLEVNDISYGYGNAFMDYNYDETDGLSDSFFGSINSKLKGMDLLKTSVYGMRMLVDCYGDIILAGGNHQYIAVPGCMNPYTWQTVDSDGKDVTKAGKGLAGSIYNALNVITLSKQDNNKFMSNFGESSLNDSISKGSSDDSVTSVKLSKGTVTFSDLRKHLTELAGDSNNLYFTIARQTNDQKTPGLYMDGNKGTYFKTVYSEFYKQYPDTEVSYDNPVKFGGGKYYISSDGFTDKTLNAFNDVFIMIDNLGAYQYENGGDYSALNYVNYIYGNSYSIKESSPKYSEDFYSSTMRSDLGAMMSANSIDSQTVSSLYLTYLFAGLYGSDKSATIGKLGYRFSDNMPKISNSPLKLSASAKEDLELRAIRDWLYYLLHPTEGFRYFKIWLTNKLSRLLVGWHNDILGTTGVGATTGISAYKSNTGYVTSPDLSEIEWSKSLIDFYNNCIPFLIIAMIITMLFAFITGALSLQRSIFGALLFAGFLFLPVSLINGVVGTSNNISQLIYGKKFTYWALVQQESYATAIDEAASGDSYSNYLRTLYAQNSSAYGNHENNQGYNSVILKWQSPKKMASVTFTEDDADSLNSLRSTNALIWAKRSLNSTYDGETYLDKGATSLYRDYIDIGNFSRYIYRGIANGKEKYNKDVSTLPTGNFHDGLKNSLANASSVFKADRDAGYANTNGNGTTGGTGSSVIDDTFYITTPLSSNIIANAFKDSGKMKELGDRVSLESNEALTGVDPNLFNFGIPPFNTDKTIRDFLPDNTTNGTEAEINQLNNELTNISDADLTGLAAYALYSENPFYYFSWKLYNDGLSPEASVSGNYKNLLIGSSNATDGGYFYNTKGNGDLKDFMDMRSLFTYIIPYMHQCNELIEEWDQTYGYFLYDGVDYLPGKWDDYRNDPELAQKYWHNLNVYRLSYLYCPWVDIMYDCDYAKPETIDVLGEKVTIQDPLDPSQYPKERPMIFSESEMEDYGLSRADLTKVEKKILDTNEGMEERMYELLNYYNFSDETLDTAAAINCAFEFNSNFSQNALFGYNHILYPQSFELSNFSYDAFLRMILANNTGDSLTKTDDFYQTIVNKSSILTAIVMLILDLISVYAIPVLKVVFIIAIFLLSILIIVATAFKVDQETKLIKRVLVSFILPMLKFFLATVGFSFVISLFMGVGNNAVTQTKVLSIKTGDPVSVMLLMIGFDIALIVIYWRIIKGVVKDIKKQGSLIAGFVGGVFAGVAGGIAKGFSKAASKVSGGSSSAAGKNSVESGNTSARAVRRGNGSGNVSDFDDSKGVAVVREDSNTRRNDSKREPIKSTRTSKDHNKNKRYTASNINEKIDRGRNKRAREEASALNQKTRESFNQKQEPTRERLRNRSNEVNSDGKK